MEVVGQNSSVQEASGNRTRYILELPAGKVLRGGVLCSLLDGPRTGSRGVQSPCTCLPRICQTSRKNSEHVKHRLLLLGP